jgi:hypothetical protein
MARWGRPWLLAMLAVVAVLALSGFSAGRPAGKPAASGGWAKAVTVAGIAKSGGETSVISCASPGNCVAAGEFRAKSGNKVFVLSQVRGTWGKPSVLPGTARTSKTGGAASGIACPSVGRCVVVGSYVDAAGHNQAFISSQVRGTWRKLSWVPGLAKLDRGHNAGLNYLSCPSAGNCTAEGSYTDASDNGDPFVVTQVRGTWGQATPIPPATGLPGQAAGSVSSIGPISCPSPGNCSAAGNYAVSGGGQVFVDNEVHGTWTAQAVPGLATLNVGLQDSINAISCSAPGNCGAGGAYVQAEGPMASFVVSESHGTWGTATEVTTKILGFNADDGDWITAMSCPSAGNCTAGGVQNVDQDAINSSVYVLSEVHGTWGQAILLNGMSKLNQGDYASISQVSCSSAGNCGVAGYYSAGPNEDLIYSQPYVANQVKGTWSKAIEVPGIKTVPESQGQNADTTTIYCPAPNRCSAGGYNGTAFVVSQP